MTHSALTIDKDPNSRELYLKELLKRDGLEGIEEDTHAAYCAISLTSTPEDLKPFLKKQQALLMNVLQKAGITAYDPGSAPFSPDAGLTIGPEEIYRYDKGRVVGARYFVTHDILPSTGVGVEEETARVYNRIAVILHHKKIRTSRMQPNRTIHLMYEDFEQQQEDFIEVFRYLQQYHPGIGFHHGTPVLLGFDKENKAIDLEEATYNKFPHLKYVFDGTIANVKLTCANLELFK